MNQSNRDSIMQYVQSLDKDQSGTIDPTELKKFFADEGAKLATEREVQVLFDSLDSFGNQDGKVNIKELSDFLLSLGE